MGIRYYAYPVLADDIALARQNPLDYMNNNPIVDHDDPDDDRLVLELDKSWQYFQRLFVWPHRYPDDPCLKLVQGEVQYPNGYAEGYRCHYAVLEPSEIAEIALWITHVDKVDVLAMFLASERWRGRMDDEAADRLREDVSYVGHYLEKAKEFTARTAAAGHGVVYRIG
ncbi:uncharacterized protein DUF1877 [Frondihabitans sp. PhB188]|uniref:DUF1877 family protein n=1 Tax=Frondihabitans sp. PhB188 TaxID=2485200 RepID=UPI000F95B11E|nr:DUF1877 family protein [Frondihabitans sp. PhB188]ROQ38485.1 uncharacterized protein DUF1877 [Frondihabitans sp. PhB188]